MDYAQSGRHGVRSLRRLRQAQLGGGGGVLRHRDAVDSREAAGEREFFARLDLHLPRRDHRARERLVGLAVTVPAKAVVTRAAHVDGVATLPQVKRVGVTARQESECYGTLRYVTATARDGYGTLRYGTATARYGTRRLRHVTARDGT